MSKTVNIGIVGTQFMGRAHSNAWMDVEKFYDLPARPVMKAACDNVAENLGPFCRRFGRQSQETDWRKLVTRDDIDVIDICTSNAVHMPIAVAAANAGKHNQATGVFVHILVVCLLLGCCRIVVAGASPKSASLDKWKRHAIADLPDRAMFILAADVDGDGHRDLIAGGWWWKNPGALGGSWKQATIGDPLRNMAVVYDFDGDGDPDILGTEGVGAAKNIDFVWARNDGKGRFKIHKNINYTGGGDFLQGCAVARLGDTIRVALSWHRDGGGIHTLNVPAKPAADTWTTTLLSKTVSSPPQGEDLDFGDIDRDGDMDLLLGDTWLRNDGDTWPTFRMGKITKGEPDRVDLADVNWDGQLDAIVSLENGTDIWWFEAPGDPTRLWTQHKLGVIAGQGFSMDTADFDGDGDPDVVIGEHRGKTENRVVIFENTANGLTWRPHVIDKGPKDQIDHHDGTQAVDLDNDGDLDIISIGWYNPKVWVYENL